MNIFERIAAFLLILGMGFFSASCGTTEQAAAVATAPPATAMPEIVDAVVLPTNEPLQAERKLSDEVEDIRLMYLNSEIQSEFTLRVGETVPLYAETLPQWAANPQLVWKSGNESCLEIDHRFQDELDEAHNSRMGAWITALSAEESPVTFTITCEDLEEEFTVYIVP